MSPIQPLLTTLPTLAVAAVYCFWQVYALTHKQREQRLSGLEQQGEKLKKQLATMQTVQALEDSIKKLNLGMGQPSMSQRWQLAEPMRDGMRPATNETQYAAAEH